MKTHSVLEALHVRCQDRVLNMRCSVEASKHVRVVCHLRHGEKMWTNQLHLGIGQPTHVVIDRMHRRAAFLS